jgi:hypothetical protein
MPASAYKMVDLNPRRHHLLFTISLRAQSVRGPGDVSVG